MITEFDLGVMFGIFYLGIPILVFKILELDKRKRGIEKNGRDFRN